MGILTPWVVGIERWGLGGFWRVAVAPRLEHRVGRSCCAEEMQLKSMVWPERYHRHGKTAKYEGHCGVHCQLGRRLTMYALPPSSTTDRRVVFASRRNGLPQSQEGTPTGRKGIDQVPGPEVFSRQVFAFGISQKIHLRWAGPALPPTGLVQLRHYSPELGTRDRAERRRPESLASCDWSFNTVTNSRESSASGYGATAYTQSTSPFLVCSDQA
jgi:hypothetical protein